MLASLAATAETALQDEPRRLALRLDSIIIEGFKVYNLPTSIGSLLPLTCIIGQNGIGKSVLGEAVAFALGANARMLRVKTLAGVISTSPGKNGNPLSRAEVVLTFVVVDPLKQRIAAHFHVRRQVTRTNRSTFAFAVSIFPSTCAAEYNYLRENSVIYQGNAKSNTTSENDAFGSVQDEDLASSSKSSEEENQDDEDDEDKILNSADEQFWNDISHANLASLLGKYGLDINALERVIVTQHRRAVEVADPKKLVKFIEQLIGSGGAQKQLEDLAAEHAACAAEGAHLDDQFDALRDRTEKLTPALHQWKRFNENQLEYQRRVSKVCRKRANLLENEANAAGKEAEEAENQLESVERSQEAARIKADELLRVKEEADEEAAAAVSGHSTAESQHLGALEELERAKAREKSALMACKRAATTLSLSVAASQPDAIQKKNTKAGGAAAALAAARKVTEQLEAKAEKVENQIATVQKELEFFEKEILGFTADLNDAKTISGEVLAARASWKTAEKKATAAAVSAQTAAEKSSEATAAASEAASLLKTQEKAASDAKKAVEKCNSSISSLESKLLAGQKEEKKAHAEAKEAENRLAAHQIKGMKLQTALKNSVQALEAAGIDADDSSNYNYLPFKGQKNGASDRTRQSVDEAVAALAEQAQHDELNPLTGAFHGRIHSILRVLNPQIMNAANAVLLEKCNPAAALVTSTRTAAEAVVSYFKEKKVGIASCTVLEELGRNDKANSSKSINIGKGSTSTTTDATAALLAPVLNMNPGAICPLFALVQHNADVAGSSLLVSNLFENWYLVSDPISAAKIMDQDRKESMALAASGGNQQEKKKDTNQKNTPQQRRNLVTLCGSLFKYDGEIIGPKGDAFLKMKEKYLLRSDFVQSGSSEILNFSPDSSSRDKEIEEMTKKLQTEYARALAAVEEHELGTDAIEESTDAAHVVLGSAQSSVSEIMRKFESVLKTMEKDTAALKSVEGALEKAGKHHHAAAKKAKILHAASLTSEDVANQCAEQSKELYQAYVDAAQGNPAAQQALKIEQAVADLQTRCAAAEKRKTNFENQLFSVQNSLQRLYKAMEALDAAEKAAFDCKANVQQATLDVAAAEEKLELAHTAMERASAVKKEATKNWREAVRHHQAALQAHQQTLAAIKDARIRQQDAIFNAIAMGKESAQALEQVNIVHAKLCDAGKALSEVPRKVSGKEAAADDVMSEDEPCSSTSSSDVESEQVAPKRARHNTGGAGGAGSDDRKSSKVPAAKNKILKDSSSDDDDKEDLIMKPAAVFQVINSDDSDSEWEEEEVTKALAELAKQNRALKSLFSALDTDAAKEALQVHAQLVLMQTAFEEQENREQQLSSQLAAARTARYKRFSAAMDAAAIHLTKIYGRLTGNIGDALCRYPRDDQAVFEQGVQFIVRPDSGSWRSFASLSGGQQALAALSLCFALQKVAPSPFYFFDEIDAALDTINSQRVAEFLRDLCETEYTVEGGVAPQIIAVSHRVSPQDAAHCILAVYPHQNGGTLQEERQQQIETGVMTLYPASFIRNVFFSTCQETGQRRLVRLAGGDGGGNYFWENLKKESEVSGEETDYLKDLLQIIHNNLPFDMQYEPEDE